MDVIIAATGAEMSVLTNNNHIPFVVGLIITTITFIVKLIALKIVFKWHIKFAAKTKFGNVPVEHF